MTFNKLPMKSNDSSLVWNIPVELIWTFTCQGRIQDTSRMQSWTVLIELCYRRIKSYVISLIVLQTLEFLVYGTSLSETITLRRTHIWPTLSLTFLLYMTFFKERLRSEKSSSKFYGPHGLTFWKASMKRVHIAVYGN